MKLIIAMEMIDSHSNLDIFRGIGMMIRLYSKLDITPFPPFLYPSLTFIFSPHLRVLVFPRLNAFNLYHVHACSSLPVSSYSMSPLYHYILYTSASLSLSNFFFMWLLKTPSPFLFVSSRKWLSIKPNCAHPESLSCLSYFPLFFLLSFSSYLILSVSVCQILPSG